MDLSHPHDKFFKNWFSDSKHLTELLQVVLPPALINRLDWATLTVHDGTFIDEEHKEHFSDLAATVDLLGESSNQPLRLYFLVEHKSYQDHGALLQILRYMVNTWSRGWRQDTKVKLTPIVPVLFYHGESPRLTTQFPELFPSDLPESVQAYLPSFRCEVLNLTAAEISDLSVSLQTQAALWAMKYSRTELIDLINQRITDSFLGEEIMTTAQALIKEGCQQRFRSSAFHRRPGSAFI